MNKNKKFFCGLVTFLLAILCFQIDVSKVSAAGAPMVIDFEGELSNGLKTEAKGTINSIDDLSNGTFKAKLLTKSEQDPAELEQFILDGPIQVNGYSSFSATKGTILTQSEKNIRFDVSDPEEPLPELHLSQVAMTKAGQSLDLIIKVTSIPKLEEESFLNFRCGNAGAITIEMKNVSGVRFTNYFVSTDTQAPIDILAFPAISDVDYAQSFELGAYPLGSGSNLNQTGATRFTSDGTGVNGIADFPLGGILYQFFGNTLEAGYDCGYNSDIDTNANGFDIFGAYGTVKDVEIAKPDFGEVVIPKAEWMIDESTFLPDETIQVLFQQPINALDENINHRYANWETTFTLPSEIQQPNIQLVDQQGKVVPIDVTKTAEQKYHVSVSSETMKLLEFAGETYQFRINGQLTKELIDGTVLSFLAETSIDGKQDTIPLQTNPVDHTVSIKVRYLRQETTDSVEKSKRFSFGYGKPWKIQPIDAPKGYYFDEASTKDELSGEKVDFTDKTINCYYAPTEKTITVNYLNEQGEKITSNELKGNYQEAYTTTANDLDDEYSLLTDRLPKNASGIVGNTDITIDYYYRQNKGHWIDLGYGNRSITRIDYHGHIRSNSINYADGQLLTLLNDQNGITLYQDTTADGAVSEKKLLMGENHSIQVSAKDRITIQVLGMGHAKIIRKNDQYTMESLIEKGNITNQLKIYSGSQLIEEQTHQANGVTGILLQQKTTQFIEDTYKVVSERVQKVPITNMLNTSVIDAPPTEYETRLEGASPEVYEEKVEEDNTQKSASSFSEITKKIAAPFQMEQAYAEEQDSIMEGTGNIDDQEDVEAKSDATFTETLSGSATFSADEDERFSGDQVVGDLEDDIHTNQQMSNNYNVKVYDNSKLLKEETVPQGKSVAVTLPVKEEEAPNEEPINIDVQPQAGSVAIGQKDENGQVTPIQDGKLPKTGSVHSDHLIFNGLLLLAVVSILCLRYYVLGGKLDA